MEEARALKRLVDEFGVTHEEAAHAVGRSRAAVSNLLRLLDLGPEVRELVERRELEMGHARALLALASPAAQADAARQVASVAQHDVALSKVARAGHHPNARLSLEGTLQPFADKLNLNLAGKIESLKLPPLSPYVIQSTGYRFTSGELQADIPLKVVRNELESELDLVLFNPKIKRTKAENTEKQQKGKIQLNTTLPSALKLLRDNQNNVKIKIPINGNINDPQFSITDAINQVLAKTLQKSALSYLKFVLGPYGIGISVAQLAYEQALKIRLNPVQFAPGSDALDEAAIDYLQRVADIMKEYAEVQVVVCGIATESDRAALDASPTAAGGNQLVGQMKNNRDEDSAQKESATPAVTDVTLLELAKNRTQRIKDQLVNRHEIAAKRIIDCNPSIDSNAKAKPRAALEI